MFHKTFFKVDEFHLSQPKNACSEKCTEKSIEKKTFTNWTAEKITCFALKMLKLKNNFVDNKDRCITQAKRTNQFQCLNAVLNSFGLSNSSSCCVAIQLNNERSIDRIFNFYSFFLSILPIHLIEYADLCIIPYHWKFLNIFKWKWNFVNCDSLRERKTHFVCGGGVCLMMYAYIQKNKIYFI